MNERSDEPVSANNDPSRPFSVKGAPGLAPILESYFVPSTGESSSPSASPTADAAAAGADIKAVSATPPPSRLQARLVPPAQPAPTPFVPGRHRSSSNADTEGSDRRMSEYRELAFHRRSRSEEGLGGRLLASPGLTAEHVFARATAVSVVRRNRSKYHDRPPLLARLLPLFGLRGGRDRSGDAGAPLTAAVGDSGEGSPRVEEASSSMPVRSDTPPLAGTPPTPSSESSGPFVHPSLPALPTSPPPAAASRRWKLEEAAAILQAASPYSCPRVLYRVSSPEVGSRNTRVEDSVVLQDVGCWPDGSVVVYEVSIFHSGAPPTSDARRCEVLLEAHLLIPLVLPTTVVDRLGVDPTPRQLMDAAKLLSRGWGGDSHPASDGPVQLFSRIVRLCQISVVTGEPGGEGPWVGTGGRGGPDSSTVQPLQRLVRLSALHAAGYNEAHQRKYLEEREAVARLPVGTNLAKLLRGKGRNPFSTVTPAHLLKAANQERGLELQLQGAPPHQFLPRDAAKWGARAHPSSNLLEDEGGAPTRSAATSPSVRSRTSNSSRKSEASEEFDYEAEGYLVGPPVAEGGDAAAHSTSSMFSFASELEGLFASEDGEEGSEQAVEVVEPSTRDGSSNSLSASSPLLSGDGGFRPTPLPNSSTEGGLAHKTVSPFARTTAPTPLQHQPLDLGLSDFELLAVIGRGGYGKVMQVQRVVRPIELCGGRPPPPAPDAGAIYALKVLRKSDLIERRQVGRTITERRILSAVRHPFIVSLVYAFQSPSKLYMVLDYVPGGDFFAVLSRGGPVSLDRAVLYLAEVVLALVYLHDRGIVYRDLKPENVLLGADGHIKLTDFGLSRFVDDQGLGPSSLASVVASPSTNQDNVVSHSFCGTEQYMAPCVLLHKGHTALVDWWSLGIFASELMTGRHPFRGANHLATLKAIVNPNVPPSTLHLLPPNAASFVSALLEKDPALRLGSPGRGGLSPLLSHPFFTLEGKPLDWNRVLHKGYTPAFIPPLHASDDVGNFEALFTREQPMDSYAAQPSSVDLTSLRTGVAQQYGRTGGDSGSQDRLSFSDFAFSGRTFDEGEDRAGGEGVGYHAGTGTASLAMLAGGGGGASSPAAVAASAVEKGGRRPRGSMLNALWGAPPSIG